VRPNQQTTQAGAVPRPVAFEDVSLIRQVQAGDLQAFAELVRKYQDRIHNVCWRLCGNREDACDLTQEVFLRAFEAVETFRGKSGFYTWIYRIAVNLALSQRRRMRVRAALPLDAEKVGHNGEGSTPQLADPRTPAPSAGAEAAERHERVAAALAGLDAEYRAALVLRDIEGMDYQEIADVLEVPVGTVKSRIFRGRMALRERLTGELDFPQESAHDGA
jgi:RNA polymerase sigma-70 factor (ECF subfamily)